VIQRQELVKYQTEILQQQEIDDTYNMWRQSSYW